MGRLLLSRVSDVNDAGGLPTRGGFRAGASDIATATSVGYELVLRLCSPTLSAMPGVVDY